MEVLLRDLETWFAAKREHLTAFARYDSRLEGWFKAELLVLFSRLVTSGTLEHFEREANILSSEKGRRTQVDFRLRLDGQTHLCELKALCISQAGGTPRNLHFYFRDDHVGLLKDFRKLDSLEDSNKWVLAFVYPPLEPRAWSQQVSSLPPDLRHWRPITSADHANEALFISLWRAEAGLSHPAR